MSVFIAKDSREWNAFLRSVPEANFLQSWEWGDHQRDFGFTPVRYAVREYQTAPITQIIQGFKQTLPLGITRLFVPGRLPQSIYSKELLEAFISEGVHIIHDEPLVPAASVPELDADLRARQTVRKMAPATVVLDLTAGKEALLAGMHPKTRYNIGLSSRKRVTVVEEQNVDTFWNLLIETTDRGSFKGFSKEYYASILRLPYSHQITAYISDTPIVSIICVGFHNTFTYLHGASSSAYRNYMATFLVQWRAIERALDLGFEKYDMWGISAPFIGKDERHKVCFHDYCYDKRAPLAGVTRFKAGFGGNRYLASTAHEIPLHAGKYRLYRVMQFLRGK